MKIKGRKTDNSKVVGTDVQHSRGYVRASGRPHIHPPAATPKHISEPIPHEEEGHDHGCEDSQEDDPVVNDRRYSELATDVQRGKKVAKSAARHPPPHSATLPQEPPPSPSRNISRRLKKIRPLTPPSSPIRAPSHNTTFPQEPPPSPSRNLSRKVRKLRKIMPRTPPTSPIQHSPLLQRPETTSSLLHSQSTSPPLQPQTQVQDEEPANSDAYDFSGRKRKRGKSCGKGVHDIIEANGGRKIPIAFDMGLYVPENETVSGFLTSEIGSIVRAHAPVCHMGWRNVPLVVKKQLEEKLLVLFEVDLTNHKILDYVDKKMAKLYSVFKWRLHKHYLACGAPREGRANPPPFDLWNGRPKQHWHWLCDKVYTAEDFLELSKTNVKNRKQLKFHHKGGAMPFIQHAKKAAKDGGHLSVIDNWETLHKDENH